MHISFTKYQGTGNDFILIDNKNLAIGKGNASLIKKLCDRKFGIGADGLMLLQNKKGYDFEMVYYNSDGNESSMCGNGGRCIVAFAHELGIINNKTKFWAIDGVHEATLVDTPRTKFGTDSPLNREEEIYKELLIRLKMINVTEIEIGEDYYYLNTGSPHYIKFVRTLKNLNVYEEGKKVRYSERFKKEGTNVNFVEEMSDSIMVRTYERGVENETLSCGTGVTAAALAWAIKNNFNGNKSCAIQTPGGNLKVSFNRSAENMFNDIWLAGSATFVFKGEIDV